MKLIPVLSTPRAGTNCLINYLYKLSYSLQETTNVFVDDYIMQDYNKIEKVEYDINQNKFLVGCELFNRKPFYEDIITKLVRNIKDSGFINEIDLDLNIRVRSPYKFWMDLVKLINMLPKEEIPDYFTWSFHGGHLHPNGIEHPEFKKIIEMSDLAIVLERKDKLKQWCSMKKAHITKKFVDFDHTPLKVKFDKDEFESYASMKNFVYKTYRTLLRKNNIPYVDIFYEEWEHMNSKEQLHFIVDKINEVPGVEFKLNNNNVRAPQSKQNNVENIVENFINPEDYIQYVKSNS